MKVYTGYVEEEKIKLLIESDDSSITSITFVKKKPKILNKNLLIKKAESQLKEYFSGKREKFSLPIKMTGTTFQKMVWDATKTIPFGETKSYGEIAKLIKNPKAVRAVGGALNKNPIYLVVPCHRVIGKNGSMTGFGSGMSKKVALLKLEK